MTYRQYRGMDASDDVYTLCPVCYNEREKAAAKAKPFVMICFGLFAIVVIVIFALIVLTMFDIASNFPSGP